MTAILCLLGTLKEAPALVLEKIWGVEEQFFCAHAGVGTAHSRHICKGGGVGEGGGLGIELGDDHT